jgi:hypothetical protein
MQISTPLVSTGVTTEGGHLWPAKFRVGGRWIEPLSMAPWNSEKLEKSLPPILRILRGDFFCLPFGGNATTLGNEKFPVHGETANRRWKCHPGEPANLHLSMRTKVRPGRMEKYVRLMPGHPAIYQRHVISGFSGALPVGHHAMLHFAQQKSARISLSRFVHGQVFLEPEARCHFLDAPICSADRWPIDRPLCLSGSRGIRRSRPDGSRYYPSFCMDRRYGGRRGLGLGGSEGSTCVAVYHFLDVEWRSALFSLERATPRGDWDRGGDGQFSSRSGGVCSRKSPFEKRYRNRRAVRSQQADNGELHHGHGSDSPWIRYGEIHPPPRPGSRHRDRLRIRKKSADCCRPRFPVRERNSEVSLTEFSPTPTTSASTTTAGRASATPARARPGTRPRSR